MKERLVRFDWAMKKLLRNKANFEILEGFLSELTIFSNSPKQNVLHMNAILKIEGLRKVQSKRPGLKEKLSA